MLKTPQVADHLRKTHQQPLGGSPEDMTAYVMRNGSGWTEVIRSADVKLQ